MRQRKDLISLTPADLESLSNRGTVKRALREIGEHEIGYEVTELDSGDVSITTSDGITCNLPQSGGLKLATCSCAANAICRHIIRAIVAYQQQSDGSVAVENAGPAATTMPTAGEHQSVPNLSAPSETRAAAWNPGSISDAAISRSIKPAIVEKARKLFSSGVLVELVKSARPFARFLTLAHTVRFLVQDDINYARCDCADDACIHIPLAIWAFRKMDETMDASFVGTAEEHPLVPTAFLADLQEFLVQILQTGIGGLSDHFLIELKRLPQRCIDQNLHWLAGAIEELVVEIGRHRQGDALYEPGNVAQLMAEICARSDVLSNYTGELPYALLQGYAGETKGENKTKRLIGLGCSARLERKHLTLTGYFQDSRSGEILTSSRRSLLDDTDQLFAKYATKPIVKGISLYDLAAGQILAKTGKLTATREYTPGRTGVSINRQAFNWELLRPPYYADSFAELESIIALSPPALISARVSATNFFVCPIARVDRARFDISRQMVVAKLGDQIGGSATLSAAYISAAAPGIEMLLSELQSQPPAVRFVAGHFKRDRTGLVVKPVSIVIERNGERQLLQPYVEPAVSKANSLPQNHETASLMPESADLTDYYPGVVLELLGELATIGLQRAGSDVMSDCKMLTDELARTGFVLLADKVRALRQALESKRSQVSWDSKPCALVFLEAAVVAALALDEAS